MSVRVCNRKGGSSKGERWEMQPVMRSAQFIVPLPCKTNGPDFLVYDFTSIILSVMNKKSARGLVRLVAPQESTLRHFGNSIRRAPNVQSAFPQLITLFPARFYTNAN